MFKKKGRGKKEKETSHIQKLVELLYIEIQQKNERNKWNENDFHIILSWPSSVKRPQN